MNKIKEIINEILELIELFKCIYNNPVELTSYFVSAVWWAFWSEGVPIFSEKLFYFYNHALAADAKGFRMVVHDGAPMMVRRSAVCDPYHFFDSPELRLVVSY